MRRCFERPIFLAIQIPFLGGALLAFFALSIVLIVSVLLVNFAIYFGSDPAVFVIVGFPIYLMVFPYFILGFTLFIEEFWMAFGIYKVFGWEKHWIRESLLRRLK